MKKLCLILLVVLTPALANAQSSGSFSYSTTVTTSPDAPFRLTAPLAADINASRVALSTPMVSARVCRNPESAWAPASPNKVQ